MKSYFKKFSIMCVMLSAIIGVGAIQNANIANAATIGKQLTSPENGWQRYEQDNKMITYVGSGKVIESVNEGSSIFNRLGVGKEIKFNCTTDKMRIIAGIHENAANDVIITIDGKTEHFQTNIYGYNYETLVYENLSLENKEHSVDIKVINEGGIWPNAGFCFSAIDINKDGEFKPYNESVKLNNSIMNLTEGDAKLLTVTTTPAGAEVVWSSSDSTIATVDSTGKVTAVKEGQATITAQIKGSETKATCTVTVTKGGTTTPTEPTNPAEPTEPTGNGSLYIEMVDGNVKQAQNIDVADFIKWFKNRDLDDNDNPIYKIKNAKEKVEYLVHDKVVGFEIR